MLKNIQKVRIQKWILPGVCLMLLFSCGTTANEDQDTHKSNPNIVVIVADDMGWADVGYHNSPIKTPHIDELASKGVVLQQYYVAPMCTPTRTALLTGRYWSRFGNTTPSNERVLPWNTWTLARAVKQAGYTTLISGKWHLGSKPEWGPRKFGFDYSHGSLAGGVHPYNHRYKGEIYDQTWHRNDSLIEEDGHVTDLIGREVVKFIEAIHQNPFFIYVPFTAVHDPFDEPEKWLESASHIGDDRRQYAASVQHLDATVGKIIDALERTGHRENTMVVFFSDNGGTHADGSILYPEGVANAPVKGLNHPLRGWKGELYEGGIRVPALVNWPSVLKPASINTPVHVTDWMPTICGLLNVPEMEEANWDGKNIWSLLMGENNPALEDREFYWQGVQSKSAAIRRGDWKLVLHRHSQRDLIELFDLSKDPNEKDNQAAKIPERVSELLQDLTEQEKLDNDAIPNAPTDKPVPH